VRIDAEKSEMKNDTEHCISPCSIIFRHAIESPRHPEFAPKEKGFTVKE
jgi:hypothetical protein